MERKKQLIRLTNYTLDMIHELLTQYSDDELEKSGNDDNWSVKDHMGHLAYWQEDFNKKLMKPDKTQKEIAVIDKENARIRHLFEQKPWKGIHAKLESAYSEIGQYLRLVSEDDLNSTEILHSRQHRALWNEILAATCVHPITHISQLYNEKGDRQRSVDLLEKIMDDLQSLDSAPIWQGTNIYNLACMYALVGNQDEALNLIAEAFDLNPELKEWSKKDTDLVSLHHQESFLKLAC